MDNRKLLYKLSLYLSLMRLDKPTGIWLLMWPCWWSIAMASSKPFPDFYLLGIFLIGAIIMRSAGCIINDIIDRKIDAQVERTKNRPLASGRLSIKAALILLTILLAIGLIILVQLNFLSISLGFLYSGLVIIYPFMKRIIGWPQIFLGITFNAGAIIGWAAVTGSVSYTAFALYLAGFFWTLGYDMIYAHQDKLYDLELGVKSIALSLNDKSRIFLAAFYLLMVFCLLIIGLLVFEENNLVYFLSLSVALIHLIWQIKTVDFDNPTDCMKKFRSNGWFGWIIFLGIVIEKMLAYI